MKWRIGALVLAASVALSGAAGAETRVDAKNDWSIFKADSGKKECWIVSAPTSSTAKRGGKTIPVKRGDILLMVTIRPGDSVNNELSYAAGYPFRKDSTVNVKIGSDGHELFTEGEWAWLSSGSEDDKMVQAMKRGAVAVVTGVSKRGTTTIDTFSLKGFTAALEQARSLCK